MPDLMIEATGLRKTYSSGSLKVEALRGINVVVAKGAMVAIMGPSGRGKTTLLKSSPASTPSGRRDRMCSWVGVPLD